VKEAQRLRRIQANRESARKTIMRKQVSVLSSLLCGLIGDIFGVDLRLLQVKVGREGDHGQAG
jgi:hypothetical protein